MALFSNLKQQQKNKIKVHDNIMELKIQYKSNQILIQWLNKKVG